MAQQQQSIAKITRPHARDVLLRKNLFERLEEGRGNQVIWISSPGGSGKTTLVSSYIETRKLNCLWYRLDEGDADPATFFYYLGIAGKKAAPRKRKPLPLLTPEYLAGLPTFSRRFFENLYSRLKQPSLIVFDNYQDVPGKNGFHNYICSGLEAVPEEITVILISRTSPPEELTRLCANNNMKTIGWDEMKLTPEETKAVMKLSGEKTLSAELVDRIHEKVDGWIAGIILLLESARREGIEDVLTSVQTSDEIFNYFTGEIFKKTNRSTQDLLLKTAYLPEITSEVAGNLTGIKQTGRILSSLHCNNFFTEQRLLHGKTVYRYHPLFRSFLQLRAQATYKDTELKEIQNITAHLLEESGDIESAAELFIKTDNWNNLVPVILRNAQTLIVQGRSQTLQKWIKSLPDMIIEDNPWLLFWMGTCLMSVNPVEATRFYENAYYLFQKRQDRAGQYLSWAAIIDSHRARLDNFRPIEKWLDEVEDEINDSVPFPSPEVEARVLCAQFYAMFTIRPFHHGLPELEKKVRSLMHNCPDINQKIQIGNYIALFHMWKGDISAYLRLIAILKQWSFSPEASPLSKTLAMLNVAMAGWYAFSIEECFESIDKGLKLAHDKGIYMLDSYFYTQGAYGSLSVGNLKRAKEYILKMDSCRNQNYLVESAQYYQLLSWYHVLKGDIDRAVDYSRLAAGLTNESGAPFFQALCEIALSSLLIDKGDYGQAHELIEKVNEIAVATSSYLLQIQCSLAGARLAFCQGNNKDGAIHLKNSFQIMREKGFVNLSWWRPSVMAQLCVKALEYGIETEYVTSLISKRNLIPDDPPVHLENWPWKVKVYTLGQFKILVNDRPVKSSGKVQKKPIEVLKALISFGAQNVREERLADELWPDADGDMALKSLETNLHRLRKLIGVDNAIKRKEGQISLDHRYCWVDAHAFERSCEGADALSDKPEEELACLGRAMEMYTGIFLPNDDNEQWTVSMRERLKSRFLRLVEQVGVYYEQMEDWSRAIELYQRGIDVDELAEIFYQRLMKCYRRLGLRAEAVKAYKKCTKVLSAAFGITPSPRTEQIYLSMIKE